MFMLINKKRDYRIPSKDKKKIKIRSERRISHPAIGHNLVRKSGQNLNMTSLITK